MDDFLKRVIARRALEMPDAAPSIRTPGMKRGRPAKPKAETSKRAPRPPKTPKTAAAELRAKGYGWILGEDGGP